MKPAFFLAILTFAAAAHADPGEAEPRRTQRWAQEPIAVPPPIIEPPARAPVAKPLAVIPPPVAIERPAVPSACDTNGCWSNDGTRLNRAAPTCTMQGTVLICR